MATIQLEASQLGARLRSDASGGPKAVQRAMFSAAQRGKALLVKESPVDRGVLRNAWKIIKLSDGVELTNDQPYAGIVENGARPFKMSKAGLDALTGWVFRKILQGTIQLKGKSGKSRKNHRAKLEQEARSIAYAIAKHFEKLGMKGKRFVFHALPMLTELMDQEISRYLDKFFNRGSNGDN